MNGVIIHKKGSKISLPIKYDFKYKVLTQNGYENPLMRQENFYNEDFICVEFEDKSIIKMTQDHRHDIIKNNKHEEILSTDLKIGMESTDKNNNKIKIKNITKEHYEGIAIDFTMPSDAFYANGILTRNCRLRLNLAELTRKNGSLFGAGDNTGSIGVVTLNLPKIGYLSHSKEELLERIGYAATIAKNSLEIKRKQLNIWFEKGLYPYTKRYLRDAYNNHFSTIGVLGMNELCRNYFRNTKKKDWNISTKEGKQLTLEILDFLRNKCSEFQVETGNLYNLESTPAESTSYRFAKHDKTKYPEILTAGTIQSPYYTNSCNLPVNYSENLWDAINHQEEIQTKFTGGCITLDTEIEIEF